MTPAQIDGIGVGAGLVGNVLGFFSQRKANETNLKINQMNNEFNERMADKAFRQNLEMWNLQNEYNSPEAQKQRYLDAGLNPYNMMSGANSGNATSSPQMGQASAAGSAAMQPFRPDGSVTTLLTQMASHLQNQPNVDADVQTKKIFNGMYAEMLRAQIDEILSRKDLNKSNQYQLDFVNKFNDATYTQLKYQRELDTISKDVAIQYQKANLMSMYLDVDAKAMLNKFMPMNLQTDLMLKIQSYENMVQQGLLTMEEIKTEITKQLVNTAQAEGMRISNKVAAETADSLIAATIAANVNQKTYYDTFSGSNRAKFEIRDINQRYRLGQQESRMRSINSIRGLMGAFRDSYDTMYYPVDKNMDSAGKFFNVFGRFIR